MRKNVVIFSMFIVFVAGCTKKQIVVCDDRLINGLILDSLLNQYFLQKNVENSAFFCMGVYISNDTLKLNILPILQKSNVTTSKPLSVFIFNKKKIFVFNKIADYLPNENKSNTLKMYENMVDELPVYIDMHDYRYPIWDISIKKNTCKVKVSYQAIYDPKLKFKPPAFKPIEKK